MLELKNITFSYGDTAVLKNFSLCVNDGKCVCLSGPSGCGKTTVLRIILGLEKPQSGTVSGSNDPTVVFQEDRLLPTFSLKTNLILPLDSKDRELVLKLAEEAGLGGALTKKAAELSGGMKRRAAIVKALAFGKNSSLLILDEPFNGIDSENKKIIANMIKREFLDKSKPVLMVTHVTEDAELLNAETIKM